MRYPVKMGKMVVAAKLTYKEYLNMEISPDHNKEASVFDELACINRAKQDSRHFKPLYEKYHEQIFLFIYRRVGDKELAKDITSDVFLKSLLKLSAYTYQNIPFSSWLYRIARNKLIDVFRKNKNTRFVNVKLRKLRDIMDEIEVDPHEQHHSALMQLISSLDEGNLQLIEMRFFENKSFKEIAEIVASTEAGVKMRVYRLLERIKFQLLKGH